MATCCRRRSYRRRYNNYNYQEAILSFLSKWSMGETKSICRLGSHYHFNSLQILRAVAALLVVFYHISFSEVKYTGDNDLLLSGFGTAIAGIDLFFVISGFIMVIITARLEGSITQTNQFLVNRITRIYPTYWVYFFLVLATWLIMPAWVCKYP